MKKIIFIIACLLLYSPYALHSQEKNVNIPKKILVFVETHFPQYKISKYKYDEDDEEHEVDLDSGHELSFDMNLNWTEVEGEYSPLPKSVIDLLPTNIPQYIAKNYPRKIIIQIEKKKYGYKIELGNGVELKFNPDGSFRSKG